VGKGYYYYYYYYYYYQYYNYCLDVPVAMMIVSPRG